MKARAFAPGHVSGLFAVHDEAADPLRKGSRGAGWCTELGATAAAEPAATTKVTVDGRDEPAPVTRTALAALAPGKHLHVDLCLQLPVGQGFGMSAAGTLAACLAACAALGLEPERALEAAHVAEVRHGTGLGDAIGSWFGCGEVRLQPGCPPHGWALRIEPPEGTRFLYAVLGQPLPTPAVIRDPVWAERTRLLGDAAVDRILKVGRDAAWPAILAESHAFSLALGLMPERMRSLGAALPAEASWGQCMLGTTMWVAGPERALEQARRRLAPEGAILEAGVDENGARLVRSTPA